MGEGAQLGLKSRKKMTRAAELLGSEHNMSESTRHELLKNGSSSDLVNIHYLHSVGGPWCTLEYVF